jgi:DNA-directed RNA polymerase specialized sigma24 family protein
VAADDLQLLLRTHRGDDAAARLIWDRHASRLVAFAGTIVRRADIAEDIVQDVFCNLLRLDRRTIAEVRDVPAWLTLLTRRAAISRLRSDRRRTAREAVGSTRPATTDTPGDRSGVDALPRRHAEVLVLRHVCGLSFDQISLALAANRNTIAARYRRAIEALRRTIPGEPHSAAIPFGASHA